MIIKSCKNKKRKHSIRYEFLTMGIDKEKWKIPELENWLDGYITYRDYSKLTKRIMIVEYTPTKYYKPFRLNTEIDLISKERRHILFVGETGSAKSTAILTAAYLYSKNVPNISITLIDGKNDRIRTI